MNNNKVVAIIVTYNPDFKELSDLLTRVQLGVNQSVVIDNGSRQDIYKWVRNKFSATFCINLGGNYGVAKAQNEGIDWAKKQQASHVIIFDQDSLPSLNMVEVLLGAMNKKRRAGIKVAAVGPNYSDIKGKHAPPFVKLIGRKLKRLGCSENEMISVDVLISSGCLISMKCLDEVGPMEEKLFIDYVDTEWCLRAANNGYYLFGVGEAYMRHNLGDKFAQVFGRTIPLHSPLRNYYLIRNGTWLLKQKWVLFNWKVMDLFRLTKIYFYYILFTNNRLANFKMMTKGLWHGLIGRMGKL